MRKTRNTENRERGERMKRICAVLFLLTALSIPVEAAVKTANDCMSFETMERALELGLTSQKTDMAWDWIQLLAMASVCSEGEPAPVDVVRVYGAMVEGQKTEDILEGKLAAYRRMQNDLSAVLGGIAGHYAVEHYGEWEPCYGVKSFSPVAAGYWFLYEDGENAGGGGQAKCILRGLEGTPIVAVESGEVGSIGWNRREGWKMSVCSSDRKRCYHYAGFQKETPFAARLHQGDWVEAGQVIGFMGCPGQSGTKTGDAEIGCLAMKIQVYPEQTEKESGAGQWINPTPIMRLLEQNRSVVVYDDVAGKWKQLHRCVDLNGNPLG